MAVCLVLQLIMLPHTTRWHVSCNQHLRPLESMWPALRNHIPCMAHVIQLALGAFMSSLGGKGRTKSWEAHECDQQFGENESIDIGKSQRLRKEGNARIDKVSAMRPGLAKIIQNIHISWYFESPEADCHIAENASCINYTNTWSPKRVHWLSKNYNPQFSSPIMDVKTHWNSTLELLERTYHLQEFTHEWLQNLIYSEYRLVFTTQDEWTIVKYGTELLRPFRYWTLWMLKRHTVPLHHVITVYDDMFDDMDGMMRALAKEKSQWKKDLFFTVKLAWQKLSKYYTKVTPMTGMLLICIHILNPFHKLRLFRKWDKGMDINPEDETSYTTQYQEVFLKYVENEYCASHRRVPVNQFGTVLSSNLVPSATASGSGQSSFDPYDLPSDDEEYLTPNNVAETTPRQRDCAAHLLTAARLHFNSLP